MKTGWRTGVAAAWVVVMSAAGALGDVGPSASPVKRWEVAPPPLISQGEPPLQRIDLTIDCGETLQRWGLATDTMLMVDNNGITWPLVTACADAGIKNLVFLPNV